MLELIKQIADFSVGMASLSLLVFVLYKIFRLEKEERQKEATKQDNTEKEFRDYIMEREKEANKIIAQAIATFEMVAKAFKENTQALREFNETMRLHQEFWKLKK